MSVDYGAAVLDAVKQQLEYLEASTDGIDAASRKGEDRTLCGKVKAVQEYLRNGHSSLNLHAWDTSEKIGLPPYEKSWGSYRTADTKWSPEWQEFHDKWVLPQVISRRQRTTSIKRKAGENNAELEDLLDECDLPALLRSNDGVGGVTIQGVQLVDGTVRCKSVETAGADGAELCKKFCPDEKIYARQVVGLLPKANDDENESGVSLKTDGAICLGVVSEKPGVLGNVPLDADAEDSASVKVVFAGWQGRVPVMVSGSAEVGSVVVASGQNDGTAHAIPEADADGRCVLGVVEKVEVVEGSSRTVHVLMGTPHTGSPHPGSDGWDMCESVSGNGSDKSEKGSFDQLSQMLSGNEEMMAIVQKLQAEMQELKAEQAKMKFLETDTQARSCACPFFPAGSLCSSKMRPSFARFALTGAPQS